MRIGTLAQATGLSRDTLRFYERQGLLQARRRANGYRDYPPGLVVLLRFITQAQDLGFSLREIADVEIGTGEHIVSCGEALALLARKRDTVAALIAEAQDRKARIEALIAALEASRTAQAASGGEKPETRR